MLAIRLISWGSVQPGAVIRSAASQLAANSKGGVVVLLSWWSWCQVQLLWAWEVWNKPLGLRTKSYVLFNPLTVIPCSTVLEFWALLSSPAFTCFCSRRHVSWQPYCSQNRNELGFTACSLHSLINCKIHYWETQSKSRPYITACAPGSKWPRMAIDPVLRAAELPRGRQKGPSPWFCDGAWEKRSWIRALRVSLLALRLVTPLFLLEFWKVSHFSELEIRPSSACSWSGAFTDGLGHFLELCVWYKKVLGNWQKSFPLVHFQGLPCLLSHHHPTQVVESVFLLKSM